MPRSTSSSAVPLMAANARRGHGRRNFDLEKAPIETIVLEPSERLLPGGELLIKISALEIRLNWRVDME
jgi:hypothetical protein